ncbi:MAG: hypothetical protein VB139_09415, partial [Coriobacteriia bacterium]|nr:hypothetical protein [Coriobacteriia bacterium]
MRRPGRVLVTALLALLLATGVPASATTLPEPAADTVIIVLAPYITWDDIMGGGMPNTRAMAESGAVANMNIRS